MQLKISKLVALAVALAVSGTVASPLRHGGLNDKFKENGKEYFGTAIRSLSQLTPEEIAVTKHEFGLVTPEHVLKWDFTEHTQGVFTFDEADKVIDWATSNGKLVRGQTLVWQSQAPSWLYQITDKDVLTEVIETHVSTIAGRYAGKVAAWDVVGEPLNDSGGLRNTVFSRVFEGPGFMAVAFKAARKADPAAKLYVYDYGIEKPGPKLDGMVKLVSQLNTENPGLIDGIASEGHLIPEEDTEIAEGLKAALSALAQAEGVKEVAITQLDIPYAEPADYVRAVQACLGVEKCVGVTVWGVSDANSWRPQVTPLLFDAEYKKKPAYDAIIEVL